MTDHDTIDIGRWRGRDAVDPDGARIGSIEDIYFDEGSDQPLFLLLKSGFLGRTHRFVPVADAREWGEHIVVAYDEDLVKRSPGIDADGELTAREEAALYGHYGLAYEDVVGSRVTAEGSGGPQEAPPPAPDAERTGEPEPAAAASPAPQPADDAMTRSEEELRIVGTETRPRERVRLRKYKVTEYVTMKVPVTREEVRLERQPVEGAEEERIVEPVDEREDARPPA